MTTDNKIKPRCIGCNKNADELDEYIEIAKEEDMEVDDYVKSEEGTYNPSNGHFYCTSCYIEVGMPLGVAP